jgi:PhnB protein
MNVKPIPEGFHTITPYFSVRGAPRFIEFLKQAFDARDNHVMKFPDGTVMSAEVQVGDSMVVIGEEDTDNQDNQSMRANLYMYVTDVDAVYKKAIQAGAKSITQPADQFWGDRSSVVEDMAGNRWWIATHKEDLSSEEIMSRAMQHE